MNRSQKTKKINMRGRLIVAILLFALLATMYGIIPRLGRAVSFESASDTISDSDPNAPAQSVTHTIAASTTQAITANGYIEIIFPSGVSDIATSNVTCPSTSTAAVNGQTLTCTFSSDGLAASSTVVIVTNTTNPSSAGSYTIQMYTRQSGGTEIEKATGQLIAIIDDVDVSATVEASLGFSIYGLATSSVINGVTTTGSSTATTLAFGTIDSTASSTLGQRLTVSTNANSGYTVTVQQDGNLRTGGSADIDSFKDGAAASSTPLAWVAPTGTLETETTYGHFGFTAQDASLSDVDPFGASLYKGFWGTTAVEVMYHSGPADGLTDEIGSSTVAYTLEITDLQETGDYENALTYICTPTF